MDREIQARASGFNGLSAQQQRDHRAKIGVRAEAILGQFWRDEGTSDAVRALEIEGWMDVLENCKHGEIRDAWATYQRAGPRTQQGRLVRPDAGALFRIAMAGRPKPPVAAPVPEKPAGPRCTPEAAARIVAEAGFSPRDFSLKRMPSVGGAT